MERIRELKKHLHIIHAECAILGEKEEMTAYCPAAKDGDCLVVFAEGESYLISEEPYVGEEVFRSAEAIQYLTVPNCGFNRIENAVQNKARVLGELLKDVRIIASGRSEFCPLFDRKIIDIGTFLERSRIIKTESETEAVKSALELNEAAYQAIRRDLKPSMTELDVYGMISAAYHAAAGEVIPFAGDIISGKGSALIGGMPTNRRIEMGDAVIVDILPERNGCFCDTTRTFFTGEASRLQRSVYQCVREALERGESLLRPGVSGKGIYEAVNEVIVKNGYPELAHHAGHGVGLSRYEAPYFIPGCEIPLQEGMIVTLEPGIYMEARFGVRLESNYLITAEGCINLFPYSTDIEYFISGRN